MHSHKKSTIPAGVLGERSRASARNVSLALDTSSHKAAEAERGSDPYNTSGSFDRRNNWARVGKR